MDNWSILKDIFSYTNNEYSNIDIRKSKVKCRQRFYEKEIIDELLVQFSENILENPIDILENYELVYLYKANTGIDIYRFQLKVIWKLLIFLRRREKI